MRHAAATYGYRDASVARVVERARVSRTVFYEHFHSRDECFGVAYDEAVRALRSEVARAFDAAGPLDPRRTALTVVLQALARDPVAARMVLIESLAGPAAVRARHRKLLEAAESWLERFRTGGDVGNQRIPAKALIGGLEGVAVARVQKGEADTLPGLADDLFAWIEAYDPPSEARAPAAESGRRLLLPPVDRAPRVAPKLLPRGRNSLSNTEVASARRDRIVAATSRTMARNGYLATTVADIVAEARLSRAAFYAHFENKEAAFLAALLTGLQQSIAVAAAAFAVGEGWSGRVWSALGALLEYFAENPDLTYLGLVEVQAAGSDALARSRDNRVAFGLFLEEGFRQDTDMDPPAICAEAIGGAIQALVLREVLDGRTERLREILPQCAYVALTPFIGPLRAGEFVEAKVAAVV